MLQNTGPLLFLRRWQVGTTTQLVTDKTRSALIRDADHHCRPKALFYLATCRFVACGRKWFFLLSYIHIHRYLTLPLFQVKGQDYLTLAMFSGPVCYSFVVCGPAATSPQAN